MIKTKSITINVVLMKISVIGKQDEKYDLGQFCYSFLFYKSFLNTNISCHNIFLEKQGFIES